MVIKYTQGDWVTDLESDFPVSLEDQAGMIIDAIGTEREWCAVGLK